MLIFGSDAQLAGKVARSDVSCGAKVERRKAARRRSSTRRRSKGTPADGLTFETA
jgi:hypothetical protein